MYAKPNARKREGACRNENYGYTVKQMGIALIASLVPVVLKGVVALIDRVKGGGSGEEKKPLAVGIIKALFDSLQKATPGVGLPQSEKEIGVLVDQTVGELNASGKLKGYATIVDSDIDAALISLCATFLESQAKRLREMVKV